MTEQIAVFGSVNSGKTILSYLLAIDIYKATTGTKVCLLSPDLVTPSVGLLFPNDDPKYVTSLASVFEKPTIGIDSILENAMTVKSYNDFCVLGFKCGDSKNSYPQYSDIKLNDFFMVLREYFDYLIVDCSNNTDDRISAYGLKNADKVIMTITPDLKGVSFAASNKDILSIPEENIIKGINITDNDCILDIRAAEDVLKNCSFTLPYSKELKRQFNEGTATTKINDRNFQKKLESIGDRLI